MYIFSQIDPWVGVRFPNLSEIWCSYRIHCELSNTWAISCLYLLDLHKDAYSITQIFRLYSHRIIILVTPSKHAQLSGFICRIHNLLTLACTTKKNRKTPLAADPVTHSDSPFTRTYRGEFE